MPDTAYREVDQASRVLDWIRGRLDEEERQHLALELLDATRRDDGYGEVLASWGIVAIMRAHPEFPYQVKEFTNLEKSGELFEGTPLAGTSDPETL